MLRLRIFSHILIPLIFLIFLSVPVHPSDNRNNWDAQIMYVSEGTINVYLEASLASNTSGQLNYLSKVVVLEENENPCQIGWKKIIYPKKGFVQEIYLITPEEKFEIDERFSQEGERKSSQWNMSISYCDADFSFVKLDPDYQAQNIGVLLGGDKIIYIPVDNLIEKYEDKIWTEIIYPYEGYVLTEDISNKGDATLAFAGTYGAMQIPYEKNLENYKNPIGGFIELSSTNWDISFRGGYLHSESNIAEYILKTDLIYLMIRWDIIKLFTDHVKIYGFGGGTYWMSNFQNTKYPSLTDYYPLEKDKDIGYNAGGGIIFEFSGIFLDVQYMFWSSREAVFGELPLSGQFTNQYKLFPGANLLNVSLGYRFIL